MIGPKRLPKKLSTEKEPVNSRIFLDVTDRSELTEEIRRFVKVVTTMIFSGLSPAFATKCHIMGLMEMPNWESEPN